MKVSMKSALSLRYGIILFLTAFLVRSVIMIGVIQPNGFFKQADSADYHSCAISIATGNGMHRFDNHEPIFWRTPGYPPFLAFFYNLFGLKNSGFEHNRSAQLAALWIQILLASCIPIILYYLALLLTNQSAIALALSWIAVIHPGLVLASTYLLTEGLALIFFYLFLIFSYQLLIANTWQIKPWLSIILAASMLSIYTWMRPMGEFIAILVALLILIYTQGNWWHRSHRALLFLLIFFGSLFPWYMRNHRLTGEWFFCPTIGTYLTCFSVPKILHRTTGKPLIECLKMAQYNSALAVQKKRIALQSTPYVACQTACKKAAYPVVAQYPGYFLYDWIAETIKTAFDLYSYQIIPMLDDSYWYDPIEEYLPDKIADCLYAHAMPWYARMVCWIEFITSLLIWIGLFGGLWALVIRPLIAPSNVTRFAQRMQSIWLISIPMIGIIIGMTGGFGYARLRLPAEPLMLILSLSFWFWLYTKTLNPKEVS